MRSTSTRNLVILLCLAAHVIAGSGAFVLCDGVGEHFTVEPTHATRDHHDGDHHDSDHHQPCSDTGYDVVVTTNRRSDMTPVDLDIAPVALVMLATQPLKPMTPIVAAVETPRPKDRLTHLQTVMLLI